MRVITVLPLSLVGKVKWDALSLSLALCLAPLCALSVLATSIPGVPWKSPEKASHSNALTSDLDWEYFWRGDKWWGRCVWGPEWEEVDLMGSLKDWNEDTKNNHCGISGEGRACPNTRIGRKILGYLQLRKEQKIHSLLPRQVVRHVTFQRHRSLRL